MLCCSLLLLSVVVVGTGGGGGGVHNGRRVLIWFNGRRVLISYGFTSAEYSAYIQNIQQNIQQHSEYAAEIQHEIEKNGAELKRKTEETEGNEYRCTIQCTRFVERCCTDHVIHLWRDVSVSAESRQSTIIGACR